MNHWTQFFAAIRAPLEAFPLGPYAALCLALWGAACLVRRYRPKWWLWLLRRWPGDPESLNAHIFQALPTTVLGGLFAGLTTMSLEVAALGALSGLCSPLWHHLVKWSPLPYRGALRDVAHRWATKAAKRTTLSLLVLLSIGCGREACYARSDAAFQRVVDDCEDAGFTYDACPWIPEAERNQEASDRQCP